MIKSYARHNEALNIQSCHQIAFPHMIIRLIVATQLSAVWRRGLFGSNDFRLRECICLQTALVGVFFSTPIDDSGLLNWCSHCPVHHFPFIVVRKGLLVELALIRDVTRGHDQFRTHCRQPGSPEFEDLLVH